MRTFNLFLNEQNYKTVSIEAETREEAEEKAILLYETGEIDFRDADYTRLDIEEE